jgi:hypothetical protein
LTLSGHLSLFIPPRVPYFNRSGTLMCTDDVRAAHECLNPLFYFGNICCR